MSSQTSAPQQNLHRGSNVDPGTAVTRSEDFPDPGLPPHHIRVTDISQRAQRRSSAFVSVLFLVSALGSLWAVVAYIAFPIEDRPVGDITPVHLNNMFIGLGLAVALLSLGIAAVQWGKALMSNQEFADERHPVRSEDEDRQAAVEIFQTADRESGFSRRTLIRTGLFTALATLPVPGVVLLRGLAPQGDPIGELRHTMWKEGVRLTHDPTQLPIKAADVTIGSVFHVIPEGLMKREDWLEQKAKAVVLLMRLDPRELYVSPGKESWNYGGIVAYSKVCTHVGCPVALYDQQIHHVLCPCHQSQFDISHEARVVFGPAARPLPQLPITVDSRGYLVARRDFDEPVGPSFWEREF